MNPCKLLAIDLDDTLLDDNLNISSRTKNTLQRARERGLIVTLATGRMYRSALPFALELGIDVPLITYQGALVKNTATGEIIRDFPVPVDIAREIIGLVEREYGFHINVYVDDNLYAKSITEEGRGYAKLARVPLNPVGDLLDFLRVDPTKMVIVAREEELDPLLPRLKSLYGDTLHITKSKPNYLEVMHPKADKGQALADLAHIYGISREEIMAFGDAPNDVEMLRYAGTAVVMANAAEEMKTIADYVTLSNNEDGVADAIKKLLLGEM